jgi:hypothetical protein
MNNTANILPMAPALFECAAEALIQAKAAEIAANLRRLEAERDVLHLLGEIDAEGTHKSTSGNYTVTVRSSMNRTIDRDVLTQIAPQIPEQIAKRLFRWKLELELRELRYVQDNEPELYGIVAQAITMKPAKPAVTVERVEG